MFLVRTDNHALGHCGSALATSPRTTYQRPERRFSMGFHPLYLSTKAEMDIAMGTKMGEHDDRDNTSLTTDTVIDSSTASYSTM